MNFLVSLHKWNSDLYPSFPSPVHRWEHYNLWKAYHGQNLPDISAMNIHLHGSCWPKLIACLLEPTRLFLPQAKQMTSALISWWQCYPAGNNTAQICCASLRLSRGGILSSSDTPLRWHLFTARSLFNKVLPAFISMCHAACVRKSPCCPAQEPVWQWYLEWPSLISMSNSLCWETAPAHGVLLVGELPSSQLHIQDTTLRKNWSEMTTAVLTLHWQIHTMRLTCKINMNSTAHI